MERVSISEVSPDARVLARAVAALRSGALIGYPTETFYGIGADPGNQRAVDALFRAKGRPATLLIPLIAASLEQVTQVAGELSPMTERLAARFWPGPLTLLVPAWGNLSAAIHGGRGTVAVRVPARLMARSLCGAFGAPVTSTSANLTGQPPAADADSVAQALSASLAMLLDGGSTPAVRRRPSSMHLAANLD